MTTVTTRAGKGSALTHAEVDANFNNLNADKLEASTTATLTNKTLTAPKIDKGQFGVSATAANNFTITAEADNGTMKLARGNAGSTTQDILTVDANGIVTATQGLVTNRMVLATAQNTTSGTTIDFTGIPSWANRITVLLNGVSTNGASGFGIRVGTSGGFVTTGYVGGAFQAFSTTNVGHYSITTHFAAGTGGSTTATVFGSIQLVRVSSNLWVASGSALDQVTGRSVVTNSSISLGAALDRVQLWTTDIFDGGSANIMYEG